MIFFFLAVISFMLHFALGHKLRFFLLPSLFLLSNFSITHNQDFVNYWVLFADIVIVVYLLILGTFVRGGEIQIKKRFLLYVGLLGIFSLFFLRVSKEMELSALSVSVLKIEDFIIYFILLLFILGGPLLSRYKKDLNG